MKITDLFFPPVCPICNRRTGKNVLCDVCELKLKELEAPSEKHISVDGKGVTAYYLFNYGSREFEKYVFALKEHGNRELFSHAGRLLMSVIPDGTISSDTVVTAIPRRRTNVREYGYDQSQKMAKKLAKLLCVRYEKLLLRKGFSKEQKQLDSVQRRRNVQGKFYVVFKRNVRRIIVVDDVLTTGSSFSECVRTLRNVYGNSVEITGLFLAARNFGSMCDV